MPGGKQVEDGYVVRRPGLDRLAVVDDDVGERGVAGEREHVARGVLDRRPAERQGRRREREGIARPRRLRARHRRPGLDERARRRPRRRVALLGRRADAPPVAAVRQRLLQRRARVLRDEVAFALAEDRRVEVLVGGDLELVLVGAGDRAPRERRDRLERRAVARVERDRSGHRALRRCGEHERSRGEGGDDETEMAAIGAHRVRGEPTWRLEFLIAPRAPFSHPSVGGLLTLGETSGRLGPRRWLHDARGTSLSRRDGRARRIGGGRRGALGERGTERGDSAARRGVSRRRDRSRARRRERARDQPLPACDRRGRGRRGRGRGLRRDLRRRECDLARACEADRRLPALRRRRGHLEPAT